MMKRWKSTDDLTLHEIAEVLARGGIVVLPTDTVYGLHASANNQRAVNRVAEMKGRSADKPFIVIAASIDDVEALGAAVPDVLHDIWPAPMTAILRRGDMTMAARVPAPESGTAPREGSAPGAPKAGSDSPPNSTKLE